MSQKDIGPETLNAYVDGELSRGDAASVARAAVQYPAIAAQIATLREMKAAVADLTPERELTLPEQRGLPLGRTAMAAAASIAILAVAVTTYLYVWMEPAGVKWASFLQNHHASWSFQKSEGRSGVVSAQVVSRLLPLDLESASLTFTGYEQIEFSGQQVLRTGYEGTRGCHVSLYVFPAGIVLDKGSFTPSLLVHTWEIRNNAFALMADGMAPARFKGIAEAVEKALRSSMEMDSHTRQQLAHARQTSPPCRA
jgi:hypothetical protein